MNNQLNPKIVYAVAALVAVVVGGIVALAIFSPDNSTTTIASLLAFVVPTVTGLLAYGKAAETGAKQDSLSLAVNGRLTQLLDSTAQAQHAAGVVQGHAAGLLQSTGGVHPADAIAPLIVPPKAVPIATISPPDPVPVAAAPAPQGGI